jgi:hypothetical protein
MSDSRACSAGPDPDALLRIRDDLVGWLRADPNASVTMRVFTDALADVTDVHQLRAVFRFLDRQNR